MSLGRWGLGRALLVAAILAGPRAPGAGPSDRVQVRVPANAVVDAGQPLALPLGADNPGPADREVTVRFTLQANPTYADPPVPDADLGYDCARGRPSRVAVDGVDQGDAKLTDGDDDNGFETPWGQGYTEAVATIDLGQPRTVRAVRWQAGDANWIWKADLSTSSDGKTYAPVPASQGVDLHAKWGGPHAFPWPSPVEARYLRLRFHRDGQPVNQFRLPATVAVYDGIANDSIAVPKVGPQVGAGTVRATVPAGGTAELALATPDPMGPGAYLLGLEIASGDRTERRWSHVFVRPTDEVDPDRARRFGINGSDTDPWMAANLRRCGFGWMRYENGKWQMYMPARDRAAFDGSVAPWHLRFDDIFATYQRAGLKVLPYIFQTPGWATSAPSGVEKNRAGYPPRDPADYGDAVFQMVARYGRKTVDPALLKTADKKSGLGLIDAVELWNEPNLNDPGWGPFVGPMSQYFEVMRAGVEGARRADPTLPVTAGGLAGIDLETVGLLAEHRYPDGQTPLDLVDVVNVHFYSGRAEPETAGWDPNVQRDGPSAGGTTYPEELEGLVAWRDRLKPGAEIWLTETGNDVGGPIGRTERHQAAKVPRSVMLALAAGVDRVFIYREAGSDPAMHAGAGLLRNDRSTRPAWLTVATMIRQLQGFDGRALRLPTDDPNVWMFLWEGGDRRLVTAWTLGEPTPLGVNFGKAEVCDGFGRTTPVEGTSDVLLSFVPTYIRPSAPTPDLAAMVTQGREALARRQARFRELEAMPMRLFDLGPAEHVGMLKGYGAPRRFTPIGKDGVWDEGRGYGLKAPVAGEDDRRWVADSLGRDGLRLGPENAFRFRLDPGPQVVRVRAESVSGGPLGVVLQSAKGRQETMVSGDAPIAEFRLDAGGEPVEVMLMDWGVLRWVTALPEAAVAQRADPR